MTGMPTEKCEEIQKSLYQISLRYIVRDKCITCSLGEFFAIIAEYEWEMCVLWKSDTECTSGEYLSRHRADPLLASHHMRYRHEMIIDDNSSMIGGVDTIRFEEYCIIRLIGIELDTTTDHIVEYESLITRYLESNSILVPIGNTRMSLFEREMSTVSIISRSEMEFDLFLMQELESLRSTEAIIRSSLFTESSESWCIFAESLTLSIWPVSTIMVWPLIRSHTDECEGRYDFVHSILDETSPIGILDPNYELSLIVSCPEVRIESGTQVTDMEIPSWRWGETGTNSHGKSRSEYEV
jgi:hypothetical protein